MIGFFIMKLLLENILIDLKYSQGLIGKVTCNNYSIRVHNTISQHCYKLSDLLYMHHNLYDAIVYFYNNIDEFIRIIDDKICIYKNKKYDYIITNWNKLKLIGC